MSTIHHPALGSFVDRLPRFSRPPPSSSSARRVSSLRAQAAFVRAFLDEIERLVPHDNSESKGIDSLRTQLVEELTRLGCLTLEVASTLAEEVDAEDEEQARCA